MTDKQDDSFIVERIQDYMVVTSPDGSFKSVSKLPKDVAFYPFVEVRSVKSVTVTLLKRPET